MKTNNKKKQRRYYGSQLEAGREFEFVDPCKMKDSLDELFWSNSSKDLGRISLGLCGMSNVGTSGSGILNVSNNRTYYFNRSGDSIIIYTKKNHELFKLTVEACKRFAILLKLYIDTDFMNFAKRDRLCDEMKLLIG